VSKGILIDHSEVLVIREIMKDSRYKKAYRMGNREINTSIIGYADESVLITNNEDNLQMSLYQFLLSAQKYDMKFSISKTKILTLCEYPLRCKLEVQGKMVEQIMSFK
jgi:hypothetical protein